MAMFQQYQNGVRPVTGMAEAGANIGNMYAQGISNMAKGLNEGIKAYNENSAKNDLANQKIQTLGQDIANKIAMYSQDPEISQSGVLEGLHQAASTLQDAPTKGLNQRLAIAHEAETRLAGFGQQLQEWSFLRGRAIERGIAEGLQQYSGTVTSTKAVNLDDPNFAVRANESLIDQKKRVMDFYGNIKKVNPKVQFDDNEFWSRWLSKAEQETSKAQGIDPSIISAQLEAIQGEKNIVGQNKVASEGLPEGAFQQGGMMYQPKTEGGYDYEGTPMQNTVKDYEATMQKPADATDIKTARISNEARSLIKNNSHDDLLFRKRSSEGSIELLTEQLSEAKNQKEKTYLEGHLSDEKANLDVINEAIKSGFAKPQEQFYKDLKLELDGESKIAQEAAKQVTQEEKAKIATYGARINQLNRMKSMIENGATPYEFKRGGADASDYRPAIVPDMFAIMGERVERKIFGSTDQSKLADARNQQLWGNYKPELNKEVENIPIEERRKLSKLIQEGKIKFGENGETTAEQLFLGTQAEVQAKLGSGTARERADALSYINKKIQESNTSISSLTKAKTDEKKLAENIDKSIQAGTNIPKTTGQTAKVPDIGLGDMIVGSRTDTRPISVSERKSQVQDFLTQRFGAIDPTDPSGKRRVPVQGFEEYFKKAVPESDIKEYTTESGIRLIQMNGKWEQMKMPEARTLQDIRKESVGIYGKQSSNGELIPTEFIPNSGVMVGGMFRGTDAANDKYTEEMTGLIDSRRSIRRLQEINDKTGEWASFKLSGEAIVEVTNLKAALRTDIIGVGTVSNFEQELIDRVIKDPTTFFSMESKDRAILLALASRVDRRIQNISAAKGLTVQIRDTNNQNSRFDDLRQRYLREKGLL